MKFELPEKQKNKSYVRSYICFSGNQVKHTFSRSFVILGNYYVQRGSRLCLGSAFGFRTDNRSQSFIRRCLLYLH